MRQRLKSGLPHTLVCGPRADLTDHGDETVASVCRIPVTDRDHIAANVRGIGAVRCGWDKSEK
jgi:hypothetical protein